MPGAHTHASSVLRRLGSGVGILSAALPRLTPEDYIGLAARVGHVRLCGNIIEPLIDWSTCPGSTHHFVDDSDAVAAIRRTRQFARFKSAATAARDAGLGLVLNPMHQLYTLEVSADTLKWVWLAMLAEFDSASWPTERIVFEVVNEPGCYNNHSVGGAGCGRFVDLLPPVLALLRGAQPSRVLMLGGEMGFREPRSGEFVNSGPALIRDAPALRRLAREDHPHLIATFHYYRPRAFTNQGFPEVAVPQLRWTDDAPSVADLAVQFDDVAAAVNASLPVYLGEYGVNVDFVTVASDGIAWMRTVRRLAESRGFGHAFWTYYLSPKAVTTAHTAALRLRQWDCSAVRAAVTGRAALDGMSDGECPPRNRTAVDADMFAQTRSFHGGRGACNDRRPHHLQAKLLPSALLHAGRRLWSRAGGRQ